MKRSRSARPAHSSWKGARSSHVWKRWIGAKGCGHSPKNASRSSAVSRSVLDCVFRPRSVAIVGASSDPTKRGYQAVRALLDAGYAGPIYPVNPRGGELHGMRVYTSLESVKEVPDLALVCTPASTIANVLESCAAKTIPAAV